MPVPAAALPNPAGLSPVIAGAWRLAEWQWTPPERLAWIEANLDHGITSIDHADADGSHAVERLLGEALALIFDNLFVIMLGVPFWAIAAAALICTGCHCCGLRFSGWMKTAAGC